MRVIHLSDIHFKNTVQEENIWNLLIEDLKKLNLNKNKDIILVTGDLIDKGGVNFNSLEEAFKVFNEKRINILLNQLKMEKKNIFFCPGNHDVDRKIDNKYTEMGLQSNLINQDNINEFAKNTKSKFEQGLFKVKSYKSFEREFYSGLEECYITNYNSNYIVDVDNIKVGITCLNTSWRCSGDDKNLIVGEFQIIDSLNVISKCDIKICIMHHSFEELQDFELRSIKKLVTENYNYLFIGHVHTNNLTLNIDFNGNLFTSTAQSNSIANKDEIDFSFAMGYSIIELDFNNMKIICKGRRYSYSRNEYVNNIDCYGDDGFLEYPMIGEEEREEFNILRGYVDKIRDVHLEDFNEHLLSYKTDTKAPKNINDVFVLPTIVADKKYGVKDEDEQKKYSIEDICKEENKVLLLGMKESGKTILMDKITIEFVEKFDLYKKVPIKIDLKSISSSSIETEIKRFLTIKRGELSRLLSKNDIILIVDNIDLGVDGRSSFNKLKIFIEKNPQVKIILSCDCEIECELPIDVIGNSFFNDFKCLYIKGWKAKEINGIINKWFPYEELCSNGVTVTDIVNIFKNMKISITPLNISMFLWIIEHQQNYKIINNAKLIESFLEHLLEKLKMDDIYSDTFDYTNKIRLLSAIANEMLSNKEKYRIEYSQLITFVNNYFKDRKFNLKEEVIIEYFINKGILIELRDTDKRMIAFRFECFYRFFIMQCMIFNDSFKDNIIKEENYLNFQTEIEYYTGIKRDEDILLIELSKRMKEEFKEVKMVLTSNIDNIDSFYDVNEAIVESINLDKINNYKYKNNQLSNKENLDDKRLDDIQKEISVGEVKEKVSNDIIGKLFSIWTLVAKVLKNTEETTDGNIKNNVYKEVIECSIMFFILYKILIDKLIQELIENKSEIKILEDMELSSKLIPIINQEIIKSLLATNKLELVIQEEIIKNMNNNKISEIEEYISLFLLFDINKDKGIPYIEKFISKFKRNYMKDILFMKIMHSYITNNSDRLEKKYLNLLSEIKIKGCNERVKKFNKSKVISALKEQKMLIENNNYHHEE